MSKINSSFTHVTLSLASLLSAAAFAAPSAPNRLIVQFKSDWASSMGSSLDKTVGLLNQSSGAARELGRLSSVDFLRNDIAVIRFASNMSATEAARKMRLDPRVEWAQPNYILTTMPVVKQERNEVDNFVSTLAIPLNVLASDPSPIAAPNLPSSPLADPALSQAWGIDKIEAPAAWQIQAGSRNIIVADIDTGLDYNHEDIVNNLWHNPSNPSEIGYDFANKDALPYDDQGHGTHTAGTIGATGGNGIGISGVAQAVSIMPVKFITSEGSGTTANAVLSIDYAIAHGARVMSNSWGGPADDGEDNKVLEDAVRRAEKADILFVAAAGNDGADNDTTPVYPATIKASNVLTVASTTNRDTRSFFSNFGKTTVHVAAPGSNVYSLMPGNKYQMQSGTSMACPHVAGLAALILAQNPRLSAVQVKEIIMATVDQLPTLQGKIVTGGRINARAALQRARDTGV